jgi:hypothetical protein
MDQLNDMFFMPATTAVSGTIILILTTFRTNCLDVRIEEILIHDIITVNNEIITIDNKIMTSLQSYDK